MPVTKRKSKSDTTNAAGNGKSVKKSKKSAQNSGTSDSESDGSSYTEVDNIDLDTIMESVGESDSDTNDLDDLGLLNELINDEVRDKWKKKIWKRE